MYYLFPTCFQKDVTQLPGGSTDMKDPSSSKIPVRRQEARRRWGDAGKEGFQFMCKTSIFLSHTHIHTERDTQRDRHRDREMERQKQINTDTDRQRDRDTQRAHWYSAVFNLQTIRGSMNSLPGPHSFSQERAGFCFVWAFWGLFLFKLPIFWCPRETYPSRLFILSISYLLAALGAKSLPVRIRTQH